MEPFPVELWAKIFLKLGKRDWLVLSRTSRLFRTLAQVELYSVLNTLIFPNQEARNLRASLLARSLAERPELAGLVQTLSVDASLPSSGPGRSPYLPDTLDKCVKNPLLHRLPSFSNLRTLKLHGVNIGFGFCSTIHSLPHVNTVRFHECSISPPLFENRLQNILERKLDLDITSPHGTEGWATIAPAGVRYLHLAGNKAHLDEILKSFMLRGLSHSLTVLSFRGTTPLNLISFLVSTPQLRRISLPGLKILDLRLIRTLPGDAIPLLETYFGPAELCEVFVHGRPVKIVQLALSSQTPLDVLSSLQHSTTSVTDITLLVDIGDNSVDPNVIGSYSRYLPSTLCRFSWDGMEKTSLMSCLPFLSPFPQLHSLHGSITAADGEDVEGMDWAYHKELVQACSEAIVSLRQIVFKNQELDVDSDGKWVKLKDGAWEYYRVEEEPAEYPILMSDPFSKWHYTSSDPVKVSIVSKLHKNYA